LEFPVAAWAWEIAKMERAVSEVQQGENTVEWLANKIKAFMDTGGPQVGAAPQFLPVRRHRRGKATQGRREAISSALDEIARQGEDVVHFRRTVLNDQLLQFEEVEGWIQEHRSKEEHRNALIVRLNRDSKLHRQNGWQLDPPLSAMGPEQIEGLAPVDALAYAKKDSKVAEYVPIGRDGAHRATWRLSNSLARTFRWQEAQATMFLLTDITPLLTEAVHLDPPPMITLPYGGFRPLSCLTRVTLTIDPMMTPREVSQEYGRVRAKLLGRKPRAQSERHLQLAVFAIKHPALDKAAMCEWAQAFPNWKHRRVSLFARDARVARDRLLHESAVDHWKLREKLGISAKVNTIPEGS
jgi:hypothetical protein